MHHVPEIFFTAFWLAIAVGIIAGLIVLSASTRLSTGVRVIAFLPAGVVAGMLAFFVVLVVNATLENFGRLREERRIEAEAKAFETAPLVIAACGGNAPKLSELLRDAGDFSSMPNLARVVSVCVFGDLVRVRSTVPTPVVAAAAVAPAANATRPSVASEMTIVPSNSATVVDAKKSEVLGALMQALASPNNRQTGSGTANESAYCAILSRIHANRRADLVDALTNAKLSADCSGSHKPWLGGVRLRTNSKEYSDFQPWFESLKRNGVDLGASGCENAYDCSSRSPQVAIDYVIECGHLLTIKQIAEASGALRLKSTESPLVRGALEKWELRKLRGSSLHRTCETYPRAVRQGDTNLAALADARAKDSSPQSIERDIDQYLSAAREREIGQSLPPQATSSSVGNIGQRADPNGRCAPGLAMHPTTGMCVRLRASVNQSKK